MLTDKNRQATTAWKPLWILAGNQTGTIRIASPATITIRKSGSEPYYILHSYMRYDINGWLYHRIRMCIWKQWKKPRTKYKNLVKLGIPEHYAATIANSRRKYWYISNNKAVIWALNKERLINSGFYDLATAYQSVHVNY